MTDAGESTAPAAGAETETDGTDGVAGTTSRTRIPELVGLAVSDAHDRALDAGLLAVAQNASHTGAGRAPVSKQEPEPGLTGEQDRMVKIWIDAGDGPPG